MKRKVTYRNMESTPPLEEFVNVRLEKIEKLLETEKTPQYLDFVLTSEHSGVIYKVEFNVSTPEYKLNAHHEGTDMYKQIENTIETMLEEIRKAKDKDNDPYNKPDFFKSA